MTPKGLVAALAALVATAGGLATSAPAAAGRRDFRPHAARPATSPSANPISAAPAWATPPATPLLSPAAAVPDRLVLDVPLLAQVENLSCEAASLQMALAFEGIHVSQPTLLASMKPDYARPELRGGTVVRWGDPYANFVGNPAGHEYDHTGYGVYYPVVAEVAAAYGARVAWSGTGLTWESLERFVRGRHPLVVWIGYDGSAYGAAGPLYWYRATDGRNVPYAPGYEHTVTVAGISSDAVLLNNPRWGWRAWLPKAAFLRAIAPFAGMAVALG